MQAAEVPSWLREYMVGASHELYELRAFPRVLHGHSFRTAAGFIFDSCHAVLLAVEGTAGGDRGRLSIASLDQVGPWFEVGFRVQGVQGDEAVRRWGCTHEVTRKLLVTAAQPQGASTPTADYAAFGGVVPCTTATGLQLVLFHTTGTNAGSFVSCSLRCKRFWKTCLCS